MAQLKLHMESNSLDENHQSAYRKNHSTETALLKITNDLLCAMDKSRCSILVMLDQSALFDTVNQDILMQRFQSTYGITGSAHAWLDSYFRHRTQAVSLPILKNWLQASHKDRFWVHIPILLTRPLCLR